MSGTGTALTPYRELGVVEIDKALPRYGRLSAAIPPPHKCELPVPCKLPGPPPLWMLLLAALDIKPLPEVFLYEKGDFWRCGCGKVFRYVAEDHYDSHDLEDTSCRCHGRHCSYWRIATTKDWLDHGGSE